MISMSQVKSMSIEQAMVTLAELHRLPRLTKTTKEVKEAIEKRLKENKVEFSRVRT